jgi:PAS domain S-box-containing protein
MKRRQMLLAKGLHGLDSLAERFAELTQAAFDGVFIYHAGYILNATPGAAAVFGVSHADLECRGVSDFVARESEPVLLQHLDSVVRGSCPAIAMRADGTTLPVEMCVQATVTVNGHRVQVVALRDTTRDEAQPHLTDRDIARSKRVAEVALNPSQD